MADPESVALHGISRNTMVPRAEGGHLPGCPARATTDRLDSLNGVGTNHTSTLCALEELPNVLRDGLQARSSFDDLGIEMRRGCVYCWLRREDDRLWGANPAYAHVRVTVDTSRCRVAEMDFASLALMYLQGQGGRPKNAEAVSLLARLYESTSVPLADYHEGMFSTPEVLVAGDIAAVDPEFPEIVTMTPVPVPQTP